MRATTVGDLWSTEGPEEVFRGANLNHNLGDRVEPVNVSGLFKKNNILRDTSQL